MTETVTTFDREKAESDLHDVMLGLGIGAWITESTVPGVAVYVCDDRFDVDVIREGLEVRGWQIEQVVGTTWDTEDGDENVVAVAFDVPDLDAEWRLAPAATPGL